jgi:hypothetical protein
VLVKHATNGGLAAVYKIADLMEGPAGPVLGPRPGDLHPSAVEGVTCHGLGEVGALGRLPLSAGLSGVSCDQAGELSQGRVEALGRMGPQCKSCGPASRTPPPGIGMSEQAGQGQHQLVGGCGQKFWSYVPSGQPRS